jgi:tRNA G18 (ribose-2'-O)-methylase SpoU
MVTDNTLSPESSIRLLLVNLQSAVNIGMILRVAETYRTRVGILGSEAVLDDVAKMRTVSDFACGALQRAGFVTLVGLDDLDTKFGPGRLVATTIGEGAQCLPVFDFRLGDIVMLGNEYDGLEETLAACAQIRLRVPMPTVVTPKPRSFDPIDHTRLAPPVQDGAANLNVAMTAGIICYSAFLQRVDVL